MKNVVKKKKLKSQIRKYHELMRLQAMTLQTLGNVLIDMLHIVSSPAIPFDASDESDPLDFCDH